MSVTRSSSKIYLLHPIEADSTTTSANKPKGYYKGDNSKFPVMYCPICGEVHGGGASGTDWPMKRALEHVKCRRCNPGKYLNDREPGYVKSSKMRN